MPWEQRRPLVRSEGAVNQLGVELATRMALQYVLPITTIALIPTKNGFSPYVTTEGMVFRLQHDPRGVPSIET
ncbi:MAG: hypothetical protein AAB737_02430, partial [Patescibacteria group bacterium]